MDYELIKGIAISLIGALCVVALVLFIVSKLPKTKEEEGEENNRSD